MFPDNEVSVDCGLGYACQFCAQEDTCGLNKPHHNKVLIENRLAEIDQIIVVLANKGGVGKSTIAANLASGLANRGFRVGMADADIHGPNQSRFFGFAGAHTRLTDTGLLPHRFSAPSMEYPVAVGSLAFLMKDDTTPIVWRDAYKHDFIHHLVGSFHWGSLDYLVIDMPPGTGNELITLCDLLEGCNVSSVLVTTPQAVAQMDSLKAARFCRERGLPIIGAVENMAGIICPHCEGEFHIFPNEALDDALKAFQIDRLASVPLAPELALGSDEGKPIVALSPESPVAEAFDPLIDACAALGREQFSEAVAHTLEEVFAENLADADMQAALRQAPPDMQGELNDLLNGEAARLRDAAFAPARPGERS